MKLIYGDCLKEMFDIPDNSIDMVCCDMPYGVTACKWDTVLPLDMLWYHYNILVFYQKQCTYNRQMTLIEYLIKTYTNEGDTVLDHCMGSGTTGVACKNLNRDFIGIEIDKEYFEIAKQRIQEVQYNKSFE